MNSSTKRNLNRTDDLTEADEQLAKGLGWFSIGLGLAEVFAFRSLARLIGVREHPLLFVGLGLREMLSGVGILTQKRPTGWLWSRVAGDMMDLSLLGAALASDDSDKERVEMASAAVLGVTAADIFSALRHSRAAEPVQVTQTIVIDCEPPALFRFWRDLENLPQFMQHIESVQTYGANRSHWVAKGPGGKSVEWDAEITAEIPDRLIAWSSLPGADVPNSGSVAFEHAPGDRGTIVRVELTYQPPGGFLGEAVARVFGEAPEQQMRSDLRMLKRVIEVERPLGNTTAAPGASVASAGAARI